MESAKVLPFYVVVDVSASMQGAKIKSLNLLLPATVDAVARNPILSDKLRFAVIDFADEARLLLPLCDILDHGVTLPTFTTRGGTSWTGVFRLLATEIERSVLMLKADGYAVHRPAVFFVSDGLPTDDPSEWRAAFADLVASSMYPNFVPFGVDTADRAIMAELVHPRSGRKAMNLYMTEDGADPAAAISAFAEVLISSVLASGQSMAQGASGILLPDKDDLPAGLAAYGEDDFV